MSWQEYRWRRHIIDGVLTDVDRTGQAVLPARWRQPIDDAFGDSDAFLAALHYRWLNTLTTRLDRVLEDSTGELSAAVRQARHALAAEQPALWALLVAHADRPSLVTARAVERRRCGWAGTDPAWWATSPAAAGIAAG